MESSNLQMSPQLEQIHTEVHDHFRTLANGFHKLYKIKDPNRQSKQLEELTGKMRECKRLIIEFDREIKNEGNIPTEVSEQLKDARKSMIKELNSYVALRKSHINSMGNKRVEISDDGAGPSEITPYRDIVQLSSEISNQELINDGRKTMDETDQAIERSKMVLQETVEVGTQTAVTLKGQTDKMGRIGNELDTIKFSINRASRLATEIGRQVATDKYILFFLILVLCGVIAIIVVKQVNPKNKDIRDIPGLAPPVPERLLYWNPDFHFVTARLKGEGRFKRIARNMPVRKI